MRVNYEVQNLKCGGCANTITKELEKHFQNVSVDVEKKVVSFDLEDASKEEEAKKLLRNLGYPLVGEEHGFFSDTGMKAKSFVSCAIGKMGS